MLVHDVMNRSTTTIDVDTTVESALELMREQNIGFLPVTHEDVIAGVITERDIDARVRAAGLDPGKTYAAEIMSRGIPHTSPNDAGANQSIASVSEEATVEEAARLMEELNVSHLAVQNSDYKIIGVVSRSDLNLPSLANQGI